MAIKSSNTRYQVLWSATPPKEGMEVSNCATKAQADRLAKNLRGLGAKNVRIWDTRHNPISDLLTF